MPLPLSVIEPNSDQPRIYFSEETLTRLGKTYKRKKDVDKAIHITVRQNSQGDIALIVDGERRWRAAKKVGLTVISCFIRGPMTDDEVFIASARANFNRDNMSPIEEARAVKRFQRMGYGMDEIAEEMGKSIPTLYNILKYMKLIPDIQALLLTGKIDKGIALKLTTYPGAYQESGLRILQEEVVKRGKPLHPNEAGRILRCAAQKSGIEPRRSKKGRRIRTYEEMVLGHVQAEGEKFLKSLKELLSLDGTNIEKVTEPHPIDISNMVNRIEIQLSKAKEMLGSLT